MSQRLSQRAIERLVGISEGADRGHRPFLGKVERVPNPLLVETSFATFSSVVDSKRPSGSVRYVLLPTSLPAK
ncbi:MAG TPA: hypothetical protein VG324_14305, partial [Blastocatellia bacterium]|nr:hypothetical protein [Blastocatellia bacterium]